MPDDEQNRFGRSLGEGYSYVALGFTFAVAILAFGAAVAVAAQLAAVALLRPAMRAPQRVFMARWLGGMGVRALALGALLVYAVTERAALASLPASLGFLGVLLPLLFVETEFLK